jgi:MSHA biogenesis protein MshI
MFVVAARNALIRDLCERAQGAGLRLAVIDVAETVQRNLLSAAAEAEGLGDRATAALMRHGEHCLLTICAGGELYYARRLDWDEAGFAPAAPVPTSLPQAMEGLDFVDYGDGADTTDELGAPRLVIELQRSFDVWERTWPDLPLARLWLEAGEASAALMLQLEQSLGLPVARLEPERLFPGFDQASGSPEVRAAILPLLGALRRAETRRL